MDRDSADRIIAAEDRTAALRLRAYAADWSQEAARQAQYLRELPAYDPSAPTGAAQACEALASVLRWEYETAWRFEQITRGCADAIRRAWPLPTYPSPDESAWSTAARLADLSYGLEQVARATTVLVVPTVPAPPRHAQPRRGVNARVLAEQIAAQRDHADRLTISRGASEHALPAIRHWADEVRDLLANLTVPSDRRPLFAIQFQDIVGGIDATEGPLVANPTALLRAYLALAKHYLAKVGENMSDYAEASGQSGRGGINISISGGTVYNPQFAESITNIDSNIVTIAQRGDGEVAQALQSIGSAVLSDRQLDDERRQELLDNVEYLAQNAQQPPEKRNRGMIKSALAALNTAATTGTEVGKAVTTWGEALNAILS
ncbi:hypothetical protein NDR87_08765 [Nocardia sp. CDC159]|uniref:AbiTii domain-containing protein n=1 Tax=Nocardia pulmonis TaxID=2951408 RepID=A0A9X2IWH2_9NOCA|nr:MULTISPECIES: hypothetical protein [Nocardia]MCM6773559.1 hypothetical protein [Nocardia pulmonis]MCM6786446.1 hypothetical protein [Nocardia sp. CDC159]